MIDFEEVKNQASIGASSLTENGKNWLTVALDPFHDTPVPLAGLPDTDTSDVVLQCHKHSYNLSAPAGTTGNWAAHIFSMPMLRSQTFKFGETFKGTATYTSSAGSNATPFPVQWNEPTLSTAGLEIGPLNVWAWASDTPQLAPAAASSQTRNFTAPPTVAVLGTRDDLRTRGRVVAMGFEVLNTTAEIYRQGLATCYRNPAVVRRGVKLFNNRNPNLSGTGALSLTAPCPSTEGYCLGAPPDTVANAMVYPGTSQWHASRGMYSVCRFDHSQNPLDCPERRAFQAQHAEHDPVELTATVNQNTTETTKMFSAEFERIPQANYMAPTLFGENVELQQFTPMDISGGMFTGLSPQTTLTINLHVYYEYAPHIGDQGFSSLAYSLTRSPSYDPVALYIYQMIASQLPPAVPQDMNPAGEFWEKVLKAVKRILPVLQVGASALGHPGVAAAAGMATKALQHKPSQPPVKKVKK
jgi:hypothetical protein